MSNALTKTERKAIDDLRDKGFAVAIFTPKELKDTDPGRVEDIMVERGWSAIEDLGDEDEDV